MLKRLLALAPPAERPAPAAPEPLDLPELRAMSLRELADLPLPRGPGHAAR